MFIQIKDINKNKRWKDFQINKNWEKFRDAGVFLHGLPKRLGDEKGTYDSIVDAWKNETCYVIGGGISGRGFDFSKLDKSHTITINHMIETYDKSEWHFFMDQRFLRITKYDFNNYRGRCVYVNSINWIPPNGKFCMFRCRGNSDNSIDLDINKGVFGRMLSGLAAVHIALLSGAKKIYLIGVDHHMVKDLNDGLHYDKNYTGEDRSQKSVDGYALKMKSIDRFLPWHDRIIQVQGEYPGQFYGKMYDTVKMEELQIVEERKEF